MFLDRLVRPFLEQVRHIHAGPLHPDDIEPQALALMGESKKLVSLDVQGYLRRAEGGRIVPGISAGLAARSAALLFVWAAVIGHLSMLTLAVGVAVTCVAVARVIAEERLLRKQYPDYSDYVRATKSLVPYLF